jgi:hypothetical protein
MYDTSGTQSVCYATHPDYDIDARLKWLKGELALAEARRATPRRAREEARALSMANPRTPAQAYTLLGMLLGLLPPAAMFGRFLASTNAWTDKETGLLAVCVAMNIICCAVGRRVGSWLGDRTGDPRARTWPELLLIAAFFGFVWGLITGGSGGVIVFGIGALAGMSCAIPVALAGFLLFAPLHRLLSHGGMIEARHLRPLALGVAGVIAALILSPDIFK